MVLIDGAMAMPTTQMCRKKYWNTRKDSYNHKMIIVGFSKARTAGKIFQRKVLCQARTSS